MAQIATALLTHTPTHGRVSKIAYHIADTYFKGQSYDYYLASDVPDGVSAEERLMYKKELKQDALTRVLVVFTED